ncbi:MAG TPA: hypothetical protein ACFE0H_13245, partial [Elainellaceae cyanobacterium]
MGSRYPDWDGASSDQAGYDADSADYLSLWDNAEELIDCGFQAPVAQPEPIQKPPEVELGTSSLLQGRSDKGSR